GDWVGSTREQADHGEIIIAADGYPSETAERAGLPEREYAGPYTVATNIEYLMTDLGVEQDVAEMYMDPRYSPGGYGWIIPKGHGRANVGIGIREPYVRRNWQLRGSLEGPDWYGDGELQADAAGLGPFDGPRILLRLDAPHNRHEENSRRDNVPGPQRNGTVHAHACLAH